MRIRFKEVVNLKGDLPGGIFVERSKDGGGCGQMFWPDHCPRAADSASAEAARSQAEAMAAIWGALATAGTDERRQMLIERHGAALVKSFNTYATLMRKLGIEGPYA
jgi:hypothetical protein